MKFLQQYFQWTNWKCLLTDYLKDKYVILDDHDFEEAAPEKSKIIELENFVNISEINPIYYETSYYTEPEKQGTKAYALLLKALEKSKKAERDKDIDESELPDNVKQALKAIRDKQEELEEKQKELQQLMSNSSMPPEEKQEKVEALQAEVSSLSRGLVDSKNNLVSSMQDQGLTEQQIQTAMALMN